MGDPKRDETGSQPPKRSAGGGAPAVSYLVRFWLEPSAGEGEPRGYVRDLQTGEERYFGDPRRFAELVLRRLRASQQDERGRLEDSARAAG